MFCDFPVQLATRLPDWSAGGRLRCSAARLSVCRCRFPKCTSTTRTTCYGHPRENVARVQRGKPHGPVEFQLDGAGLAQTRASVFDDAERETFADDDRAEQEAGQTGQSNVDDLHGVRDDHEHAAEQVERVLVYDQRVLPVLLRGDQRVQDERVGGRSDDAEDQDDGVKEEVVAARRQRDQTTSASRPGRCHGNGQVLRSGGIFVVVRHLSS